MPRQPGTYAIFNTSEGTIVCRLFEKDAPKTVANFTELAEGKRDWTHPVSGRKTKDRLYDGTIFHRVIPNFMIQGGDPAGTGSGEIGIAFKNEVSPDLKFDRPGRLAYANAGPDTNGSQFFITETAFTGQQGDMLNGHYTIFGQCDDATVALVKQIARMGHDANDLPYSPVKINHITIVKGGASSVSPAKKAATPAKAASPTPKQ